MPYLIKVQPNQPSHIRTCDATATRTENTFCTSLKPFAKWMNLIGTPLPMENNSSCLRTGYSVVCFLTIVSMQIAIVTHIFFNARSVSVSYVKGISTSATAWNFIIDNTNLAMETIGGHGFLLFLTRKKNWMDLVDSFVLLEESLKLHNVYPKCRKLAITSVGYIIISVCICWSQRNVLLYYITLNSKVVLVYRSFS